MTSCVLRPIIMLPGGDILSHCTCVAFWILTIWGAFALRETVVGWRNCFGWRPPLINCRHFICQWSTCHVTLVVLSLHGTHGMQSSLCNSFENRVPVEESTGAKSSNELQRFDLFCMRHTRWLLLVTLTSTPYPRQSTATHLKIGYQ